MNITYKSQKLDQQIGPPLKTKKDTPNPALRVKEKLLAVLKIIVKYQDK